MRRLVLLALALPAWAGLDVASVVSQTQKPAVPPFPAGREEAGLRGGDAQTRRREEREALAQKSLEKGLVYLAKLQAASLDGSFPTSGAEHSVPVAVAALGALAYMAGGSTPDRGPQGAELSRTIDYLVTRCDLAPGSKHKGYISSDGDELSRMHGHGFATLAMAEAFAMSPTTPRGARLKSALEAAVHLIETAQGTEGGWMYQPEATYEHENSVTVCLVQALRSAHGAGVHVDPAVIARAVDYIRRCQSEDGSFRYALNQNRTSAALTAASLTTLNATGVYDGPAITRGLDCLARDFTAREREREIGESRYPHYERLYVAQALWQASDLRLWEEWRAKLVAQLESEQAPDGSWSDAQFGAAYATAVNSLVLAIPQGFLPLFQR
ncbi:MAG TPA: prenyltransferase/squalene oxidase repeat-containing protein [Planctomycetota bacterium]|nr:prenyltransferase/squalene oxidase repeat-containing protein [Planctomycetota bacterium]